MISKAATTIQRYWRGYLARLRARKRLNKLEKLLGMTIPSWQDNSIREKDLENFQRRQKLQPQALEQTQSTINKEKLKV